MLCRWHIVTRRSAQSGWRVKGGRAEDSEEQLLWLEHEKAPQKPFSGSVDRKARQEGRECLALYTWCHISLYTWCHTCQYMNKTLLAAPEEQSCRVIFANDNKKTAIVLSGTPLGFCMGSAHVGLLWSIYIGSSLSMFSVSSSNTSYSLNPPPLILARSSLI